MTTSTKQFAWKDRTQAAVDLLQLVYHAPPSVSSLASRLLSAIRSPESLPELVAIVLDENYDRWTRIHALRACAKIPTNTLVKAFEPLVKMAIHNEVVIKSPSYQPDLLYEFASFVNSHPINMQWFFGLLDDVPSDILFEFVVSEINHRRSGKYLEAIFERATNLLDSHTNRLDIQMILRLADHDFDMAQSWLDQHFEIVLAHCLKNPEDYLVIKIAQKWKRLRLAIQDKFENWHVHPRLPRHLRKTKPLDYEDSPAYQYLYDLYVWAQNSDAKAYGELVSIARKWRGNIPMRATATHWIGQLADMYDVFPILAQLMRSGNVNWDLQLFDSPIRYEAGEALLNYKTAETWEVYVDSYFINPRDELLFFQSEWIAYLTDVLSGEDYEYAGSAFGSNDNKAWFRKLVNVPAEDLT